MSTKKPLLDAHDLVRMDEEREDKSHADCWMNGAKDIHDIYEAHLDRRDALIQELTTALNLAKGQMLEAKSLASSTRYDGIHVTGTLDQGIREINEMLSKITPTDTRPR